MVGNAVGYPSRYVMIVVMLATDIPNQSVSLFDVIKSPVFCGANGNDFFYCRFNMLCPLRARICVLGDNVKIDIGTSRCFSSLRAKDPFMNTISSGGTNVSILSLNKCNFPAE
jgi:hypothetical protein